MEELLKKIEFAKTRPEKQILAAQIIANVSQFLKDFGELEQRYNIAFRKCVISEGTKSGGELVIAETDIYKEYKYKKRLYEAINTALMVLNMYTGVK